MTKKINIEMSFVPNIRRSEDFDDSKLSKEVPKGKLSVESSVKSWIQENQTIIIVVIVIVIISVMLYFFRDSLINFLIEKLPSQKRIDLGNKLLSDTQSTPKTLNRKPKQQSQSPTQQQQTPQQQHTSQTHQPQTQQQQQDNNGEEFIKINDMLFPKSDLSNFS